MIRLLFAVFLTLVVSAVPALAQPKELPSALLADAVSYDRGTQVLTASGNVQIFYEGQTLEAQEIVYDAVANTVKAMGPLSVSGADGTIILADAVNLSADLREGLIQGARLLLHRNFQFAALEARRTGGRFTSLHKSVGSSCRVCNSGKPPMWLIRADRVIRDELEGQIYFENAQFDFMGATIAYLPYFRMADPAKGRATGFLNPVFVSSDLFGGALKIPYYIVLGPHSDATITPFVTNTRAVILEGEYRRRTQSGGFDLNGAIALDDGIPGRRRRGFLFGDGSFDMGEDFTLDLSLRRATDKSFLRQFDYSTTDRLESSATLTRQVDRSFMSLAVVAFQSLRDDEDNDTIPFVLPEFSYDRYWQDPDFGQFGLELSSLALTRIDGQDMARLGAKLDWSRNFQLGHGLLANTFARAQFTSYRVANSVSGQDGNFGVVAPTIGADLRWPWAKTTARATHVIEPRIQAVSSWPRGDIDMAPNEDSNQLDFDESNLFSLNRFPGQDLIEDGFRINAGLTYSRYDPDGWQMSAGLGQVFRLRDPGQFSAGSGLAGLSSDYVATMTFALPPSVNLINRALFDPDLTFSRAESRLSLNFERWQLEGSYVFLAPDVQAGALSERHEMSLNGRYQFQDNWALKGEWRRELDLGSDIYASAGLEYGNECIDMSFSVSRTFTTSNNVPPATRYSLRVRLAGLGSEASKKWPARKCGVVN